MIQIVKYRVSKDTTPEFCTREDLNAAIFFIQSLLCQNNKTFHFKQHCFVERTESCEDIKGLEYKQEKKKNCKHW